MTSCPLGVAGRAGDGGTLHWSPLADLTESEDAYLIEVDLPGVKRDDSTIELAPDEIIITGEFKEKERTGLLRSHTHHTGGAAAKPRRIAITGG